MFRIASKGLLGRKKESFMLLSILFLSFLFSILTSTFYTNSEAAKALQRERIYGQWAYAAFAVPEGEDPFAARGPGTVRGRNRIIGHSPTLGTLTSFDEGFQSLANLNLLEGRMPAAADEVALEQNQLSFFEQTPAVGDEILADTEVFLFDLESVWDPDQVRSLLQEDAARQVLEGVGQPLKDIFSGYYELPWDSPDLRARLEADLPAWISVVPGNRERRRGLEHFEDTLMLPNEERLKYTYEINLSSIFSGETLTDQQQKRLLEELNGYLLDHLTDPLAPASDPENDPLSLRGEGALLFKQSYIIRRTLTVTGVYTSLSNAWIGERTALPTALVTESTAGKFIENGLMQTVIANQENFHVPVNYYMGAGDEAGTGGFGQDPGGGVDGTGIVANTLAFPPGDSTDGILALSMMVFIFFITLFGVFQLYMSQLTKRLRKLGLLRSVGATTGQIRQLLGWELVIILAVTLPLALISGLGLAWLFTRGFEVQTPGYQFAADPRILAVSILSGILAVVLGVLQPLLRIRDIPLTGKAVTVKTKDRPSVRQTLGRKIRPIRTLEDVLAHHRRFTRRQSFLTQAVYAVIFTAMLLSLLLSFLSFVNYRDRVVAVNMPDYDITFSYGLNRKDMAAMAEEFTATGAVSDIQQIIGRKGGQLSVGDWIDPLYDTTRSILPPVMEGELFLTEKETLQYPTYFTSGLRKVNIYGIESDSLLFDALDRASGGLLRTDVFQTGRSAVMLYPGYLEASAGIAPADPDRLMGTAGDLQRALFDQTGAARLSFDFRASPLMDRVDQDTIPGRITLTFNSEQNTEIERNVLPPSVYDLDLGAVITQLPEFGIWPFSASLEHPVVIGSEALIRQMTDTRSIELLAGIPASQTLVPTLYGIQRTSLWTSGEGSDEAFLTIQQIAHRYGGKVSNLLADKEVQFNSALRISIMVLIVAFVIGLAALQIQLNISKARVESERLYIGTLQSLGVSNGKLRLAYLKTGLGYSVIAVIVSHLVFFAGLMGHILLRYPARLVRTDLIRLIRGELWLYPWTDHLMLTLIFLILGMLIYYLPLRRILKIHPINNIRQL